MGLFDRLKKSNETKAIHKAYDKVFDSNLVRLADDRGFSVALNIIKKDVKKYIDNINNEKEFIKIANEAELEPIDVIYSLMRIKITGFLQSGEYHFYRGILNDTGKEMLKFFDHVQDWYASSGIYSLEYARGFKEDIREDIKTVG